MKHSTEEKVTLAQAGKALTLIIASHKPGSAYWHDMAQRITERGNAYAEALVREALEGDEPDTCEQCGDPSGGHALCGECYDEGNRDWCGHEDAYGDDPE